MRISFSRPPSSYRSVSAIDVLNGNYDSSMFDNTWVLVGATAFALDDVVPTPYSGSAPGVELQARMIGSVLDSNVPYVPRGNFIIISLAALLMGTTLLFCAERRGKYAVIGLPFICLLAPVIFEHTRHTVCSQLMAWLAGTYYIYNARRAAVAPTRIDSTV